MPRYHTFSSLLSDTFLGNLKKTIHRDSANELFKLLNRDPLSESIAYSDNAMAAFLLKHPEVYAVKYAFEAFNEPIYPLSMLCALRPSAYAVQLCFEAHEDTKGCLGRGASSLRLRFRSFEGCRGVSHYERERLCAMYQPLQADTFARGLWVAMF